MEHVTTKRTKDILGGALMVLLGLGAVAIGMTYQIGTLSRMGPGFFPVALGAILAFSGGLILIAAKIGHHEGERQVFHVEWKAWALIAVAIIAFLVLGRYGGLVPATFAIVFISALADRDNSWKAAAVLAVGITLVAVVVFWWALQMQFPLINWG